MYIIESQLEVEIKIEECFKSRKLEAVSWLTLKFYVVDYFGKALLLSCSLRFF